MNAHAEYLVAQSLLIHVAIFVGVNEDHILAVFTTKIAQTRRDC
jgi:hypothetical protein